jgi:rhodanese-related sulfurtransferase
VDFFVFVSEQWILVSALMLIVYGYFWTEKLKSGQALSIHEVTRVINNDGAVILDIREAGDFKNGHLVGAINIPHNKVMERVAELEKSKDKTILLIDKVGQHSGPVGRLLKGKGFEVSRMQGGISEWQAQNLPLVK